MVDEVTIGEYGVGFRKVFADEGFDEMEIALIFINLDGYLWSGHGAAAWEAREK